MMPGLGSIPNGKIFQYTHIVPQVFVVFTSSSNDARVNDIVVLLKLACRKVDIWY